MNRTSNKKQNGHAGEFNISGPQPNIIFILVDEMRFPMHFPQGLKTPGEFLARFMPNLYSLWKKGVKFTRYYTAAADCTPGRGTIVTGLYAYQNNLFLTRQNVNKPYQTIQSQPPLQPEFPTYGKLLREAGYETPYIGKWHLSNSPASPDAKGAGRYLDDYGFQGLTIPDPLGMPAQGLGLASPQYTGAAPPTGDPEISTQALRWLQDRAVDRKNQQPFCLTVGFVNPHDKQFYWGGTQAIQFNAVYNTIPDPSSPTGFEMPFLNFKEPVGPPPPPQIYEGVPSNWETSEHLRATKPELQTVFKEQFAYYFTGDIAEDQSQLYFRAELSPFIKGKHKAVAPFSYWARALDFYTQMMSSVDVQIGQLIHNIPEELARNTLIVFSSDHGELASSHGMQGKGGSVYEEGFKVPLIVFDPEEDRYTRETETERDQLASSVDFLPLLATIGNCGSRDWLRRNPEYRQMYGNRADLFSIMQDPEAPGREYVVYTTDELFTVEQDYLHAPQHVIGQLTAAGEGSPGKLGFYHHWKPGTTDWDKKPLSEKEYYDYTEESGRLEIENRAESEEAEKAFRFLTHKAIPEELKAPLPKRYSAAQQRAIEGYWKYAKRADIQAFVSTAFA